VLFGRAYPKFELAVVTTDAEPGVTRQFGASAVRFMTLSHLIQRLAPLAPPV